MSNDLKRRAEAKRQSLIAIRCAEAIEVLTDDTGAIGALPREIRDAILGEIEAAVRTLSACERRAHLYADSTGDRPDLIRATIELASSEE